tara:strand:+ start:2814 stop:3089 length:276 start_codon:yes stop_codon:yes gene_type:complete
MKTVKNISPEPDFSIVHVSWVDSCEPRENAEIEVCDIPSPQLLSNVGFLIKEKKDYISIAGSHKKELLTFDYVISIPKKSITKIFYLYRKK